MKKNDTPPPVVCFVGTSGSGKTCFLEKLVREFTARGIQTGVVKHAHHGFDLSPAGKDSTRHAEAGAKTVIVTARDRLMMVRHTPSEAPENALRFFDDVDIVLIEGYKSADFPKIEVFRPAVGKAPLYPRAENHLIALVTDGPPHATVPSFGLEAITEMADFITTRFLSA